MFSQFSWTVLLYRIDWEIAISFNSDKMIPNQILRMLTMYDYNFSWSKFSKSKKNSYVINSGHILMAMFLIFYEFTLIKIYCSRLKLLNHLRFNCSSANTQAILGSSSVSQMDFSLRNYLAKFIIYLIKTVVTCAIRLMGNSYHGIEIGSPYVFKFIICEIRMFYLLCLQLKIIETESRKTPNICNDCEIIDNTQCHRFKVNETVPILSTELQRVKWIRKYFYSVYEMVCLLNKIFGWSNVAAISFCFCFLLTELHWYYIHFWTTHAIFKFGI